MKKNQLLIINYLFLLLILFTGFWTIVYFKNDRHVQVFSAFLMSSGYVIWGAMHHLSLKSFRIKVMVEYVVFALIVFAILTILILRS